MKFIIFLFVCLGMATDLSAGIVRLRGTEDLRKELVKIGSYNSSKQLPNLSQFRTQEREFVAIMDDRAYYTFENEKDMKDIVQMFERVGGTEINWYYMNFRCSIKVGALK